MAFHAAAVIPNGRTGNDMSSSSFSSPWPLSVVAAVGGSNFLFGSIDFITGEGKAGGFGGESSACGGEGKFSRSVSLSDFCSSDITGEVAADVLEISLAAGAGSACGGESATSVFATEGFGGATGIAGDVSSTRGWFGVSSRSSSSSSTFETDSASSVFSFKASGFLIGVDEKDVVAAGPKISGVSSRSSSSSSSSISIEPTRRNFLRRAFGSLGEIWSGGSSFKLECGSIAFPPLLLGFFSCLTS